MESSTKASAANGGWKKGFFTIYTGQALSLIGSSAVQFCLIWWLSSETGSALMLSLAGLLAFLPQFLLGPFVGVWVDRFNRKTVIICADLFSGLVAAAFAIIFFFHTPPYWSACVVIGLRAVGSVFHTPAIQAAVPMLVPKEELTRANGWSQFLQSGAYMLGPVLGAAMYAGLTLPVILLSDLLGALITVSTVAMVRIPELTHGQRPKQHFLMEMREGAIVFLRDKKLTIVTVAMTLGMVFFMPLGSLYPLMVSHYFLASTWHASINQIGYAAGMMLGSVAAGSLSKIKNKLLLAMFGFMGASIITFLCGILPATMVGFWLFTLLCLLLGASGNMFNIPFVAYMQATIPPEAQGRAFSLMNSLSSLSMPVGLALAGPMSEQYGVPFWFFVSGIAMVVITGAGILAILPAGKKA